MLTIEGLLWGVEVTRQPSQANEAVDEISFHGWATDTFIKRYDISTSDSNEALGMTHM